MSATNRQILLVRVPTGALTPDCFKLERAAMPEPKEGEVLLIADESTGPHRVLRRHVRL